MAKRRITLKLELDVDEVTWTISLDGWKKDSGIGLDSAEKSLRNLAQKATEQTWGDYFLGT